MKNEKDYLGTWREEGKEIVRNVQKINAATIIVTVLAVIVAAAGVLPPALWLIAGLTPPLLQLAGGIYIDKKGITPWTSR